VIEMCVREEDGIDVTVVEGRLCESMGDPAPAVDEKGMGSALDDGSRLESRR